MSGDLEDFLRRAAQRRQASLPPAQAATPSPARSRPEYSNRQAERKTRAPQDEDDDDIPIAAIAIDELVEEDPYAMQRKRIAAAKAAAEAEAAQVAARFAKLQQPQHGSPASNYASSGNLADDLIGMLRTPGGIQQAILLREILDRPEHRW